MQRQLINWDKPSNSFPLALMFLLFLKLYHQMEILIVHIFITFNIFQKIKIIVFGLLFSFFFFLFAIMEYFTLEIEREKKIKKVKKKKKSVKYRNNSLNTLYHFLLLSLSVSGILSFHVHYRRYGRGGIFCFFGWVFWGFVWFVGWVFFIFKQ